MRGTHANMKITIYHRGGQGGEGGGAEHLGRTRRAQRKRRGDQSSPTEYMNRTVEN